MTLSLEQRCSENFYNAWRDVITLIWLMFTFSMLRGLFDGQLSSLLVFIVFLTCFVISFAPFGFYLKEREKRPYCLRVREFLTVFIESLLKVCLAYLYAMLVYIISLIVENPEKDMIILLEPRENSLIILVIASIAIVILPTVMHIRSKEIT